MHNRSWIFPFLAIVVVLFLVGCKLTRADYASADYTVVSKQGSSKIRDYPALTLISTTT